MYKAAGAIGFVAATGFESRKFIVIRGKPASGKSMQKLRSSVIGMGAASRAVVCAASCTHSVPGEYCPAGYALDRAHVNFPASSPFVLRVGGTMLSGTPPAEVVWRAAPGDQSQGGGGGSTDGGVASRSARPYVRTSHRAITTHLASLRAMRLGWGTTP